jgi:MFS family permease
MTTTRPAAVSAPTRAQVQRRTLRLLFATQVVGSVGLSIGISVGALLTARLAGTGVSGLAQSAAVVGGALLVIPVTRLIEARGRRPGLALAYAIGAVGAVGVVVAAVTRSIPLLFAGMLLFGGGTTAGLQARYAAVDLAEPDRRGRQLSLIVWAATVGAVAAPNFAALSDDAVDGLGLPALTGPFVVSAGAFLVAGALLAGLMRPDPLLTARRLARTPETDAAAGPTARPGLRPALAVVLRLPRARLGMVAVAVGHLVMVGVMAMTPVHIGHHHGDADVLRIVGIVLSLHVAGMYAFSPVVGWLTDRFGRRPVILGGAGVLVAACGIAGTAGADTPRLSVGLFLLGLGWSGTMVAGSTLLSESVPVDVRPGAQGLSDLVMGLAGASAGALSGFVVEVAGYPRLNLASAIAVVPLVALALLGSRQGSSRR